MTEPLHVLVVHESYLLRGGEERVVESEVALLRSHGHRVTELTRNNEELRDLHPLKLLQQTFWSGRTTRTFDEHRRAGPIDVVHVHNTLPLVSPSVYWAASRHGVPVVQTLHNFRLLCPQAMFLRDGQVCEDCLGRIPWRGAARGCYRGSVPDSTVMAGMLSFHRAIGTWQQRIQRYIALSSFSLEKFVAGGLPADRLVVKPNFVADLGEPDWASAREGFLYVGRLSAEKGLATLAQALSGIPDGCRMRIAGAGPLQPWLSQTAAQAQLLGELSADQVRQEMLGSLALLVPSICYENFPLVLLEAFSAGLPVIASRIGALAELVEDGVTGLLFEPGDSAALARCLNWALAHREDMRRMGMTARQRYLDRYTASTNYRQLLEIYAAAGVRTRPEQSGALD